MFGYVTINKPELKVKDFYKYKAYYCGLCHTLCSKYGPLGQMTLSYDMTFLIILLNSLYESNTPVKKKRCVVHPVRKQQLLCNDITGYVADMNITLTYHHLLDDWRDEKSIPGISGAKVLEHSYKKIRRKYPRQCEKILECLNNLEACEKRQEADLDTVSRCFAELMSEIFVYRQDVWEGTLRNTGFYLGKFIYILDAYDDIEKDRKQGSYNPLLTLADHENFETDCRNLLVMMMAQCSREFEKLPCLNDAEILRNILYEGVWIKFNKISEERAKRKEQKNVSRPIQST